MSVAAIVLAAGRSTRMGEVNKLTAPFRGKPLVWHVLDALSASSIPEIIVVVGHDEAGLRQAIGARDRIQLVPNAAYESGMASSIASGIGALGDAKGALIVLADMPFMSSSLIDSLVRAFRDERQIIVPTHQGRRGHPVLFGRQHFQALQELRGDRGARDLINTEAAATVELDVDDPGIHRDLDTRADFERVPARDANH